MEFVHKSVLLEESINWLITDKDGIYVDCTMGGAGHSKGFAMQLSSGARWSLLIRTMTRLQLQVLDCRDCLVK